MSLILTLVLAAETAANPSSVPEQNQKKPPLESIAAYDPEPLLNQLNQPKTEAEWNMLFFPADAFNQVKGIKDPGAYHKQLLKWFAADIKRESERLKAGAPWQVESFKLGSCKWKEKGTEANALPYWSCYKSKLKLKNAKGETNQVDIRALINWGTQWYITHLGPIPK